MFRLPSEKVFLLGSFDYNDVFGERKGLQHSPHLRAQMNMDSNIIWAAAFFSLALFIMEQKRTHNVITLRENMQNANKGFFTAEDFN